MTLNPKILDIVRRAYPKIIAQEICGVQPMGTTENIPINIEIGDEIVNSTNYFWVDVSCMKPRGIAGQIFTMRLKYSTPTAYGNLPSNTSTPAITNLSSKKSLEEMLEWCKESVDADCRTWFNNEYKFYFANEEDRLSFILKWCD